MRRITLAMATIGALACAPAYAQSTDKPTDQPQTRQPQTDQPRTAPGVDVERVFPLQVGDRAPELAISEWIKGDPVTGFDKGRVYVVEFWATWCGPCIAGMPHISKLQEKYADKGVRIIGVNIWDEPANARPFIETGRGKDITDYTIAVEEKHNPDDPRNGLMAKNWMRAAGQNGIPSAFLIDQNGYVAWIGHPMSLDEPLEKVVAREWDLQKAANEHVSAMRFEKKMQDFQMAVRGGDADKAGKLAKSILESKDVWDNAQMLNSIAWMFVDPDGPMGGTNTDLALKAAQRAVELTDHADAMVMDTLAWAQFHAGMTDKALETEQKAVELAPSGQARDQLQQSLDRMRKMAGDG